MSTREGFLNPLDGPQAQISGIISSVTHSHVELVCNEEAAHHTAYQQFTTLMLMYVNIHSTQKNKL